MSWQDVYSYHCMYLSYTTLILSNVYIILSNVYIMHCCEPVNIILLQVKKTIGEYGKLQYAWCLPSAELLT